MENQIALSRLAEERKSIRQDRPAGCYAKPLPDGQGGINFLKWECGIQAKSESLWSGVTFKLIMDFPEGYPLKPPLCRFSPPLFHPNVYPSGIVCLSLLNEDLCWRPSITIKDILKGIQELLDTPNVFNAAQHEPARLYRVDIKRYRARVRSQILALNK